MIRLARRPVLGPLVAALLLAALVLPASLLWPAAGRAQSKPLRPYTLILDFVPTGEYVPHYTALEKGFYRDEGLDVKILRGQGSGDTSSASRPARARSASRTSRPSSRPAPTPTWPSRPSRSGTGGRPTAVFVRADSPIKTSKDLEGKKLAISPGNSHQILWPVYEKLSGLKPGSVSWVTMDAASMPPALIRGAVDAVPFFVVHEARIRKIAKQQNTDIRVLAAWADLGFDVASTSLVAREDTIAKDPEGLKAFLRATLKGADYAFRDKHWDEGVGYVVKAPPRGRSGRRPRRRAGGRALRVRERGHERQDGGRPVRSCPAREDPRPLHPVPRAEAKGRARGDLHQRPAAGEEVARPPEDSMALLIRGGQVLAGTPAALTARRRPDRGRPHRRGRPRARRPRRRPGDRRRRPPRAPRHGQRPHPRREPPGAGPGRELDARGPAHPLGGKLWIPNAGRRVPLGGDRGHRDAQDRLHVGLRPLHGGARHHRRGLRGGGARLHRRRRPRGARPGGRRRRLLPDRPGPDRPPARRPAADGRGHAARADQGPARAHRAGHPALARRGRRPRARRGRADHPEPGHRRVPRRLHRAGPRVRGGRPHPPRRVAGADGGEPPALGQVHRGPPRGPRPSRARLRGRALDLAHRRRPAPPRRRGRRGGPQPG